jgi:hypothetical protein
MANYYFRNTGNPNFSTFSNWSLSDGGPSGGGAQVPSIGDNAYFTSNSGDCTIAGNPACGGWIFAGVGAGDYSGTLTIPLNQRIRVSTTSPGPPSVPGGHPAAFVLSPTMTILGGGTLSCDNTLGTVTFTSNGCTSVPNLNLRGASTKLFTDTWTLNGSLSFPFAGTDSVTLTLGANIINVKGNLFIDNTTGNINQTGTGGIILNGAGPQIWSQPNYNGGALRTNLTISNPNVVISGTVAYGVGTLRATTSAITTRSTLVLRSSCTLNTSLINWDNVNILGGATITMNDFFNGTPQVPTKVDSTTTNYTINFTDGFEKLAKNVRVSRCTISRRGQLLLLSKGGFGVNNIGIRYYNQLPNGVSTDTQRFVNNNLAGMPPLRAVNMLVGDPVFT